MIILLALILTVWSGPALLAPTVEQPAAGLSSLAQPPTPSPEGEQPPQRVSLTVLLALVCVFNLSVIALLGSIALRRRIDSISPDK